MPADVRQSLLSATELLRRRQGELREHPLPTMEAAMDELLGGGLPRGALVELVGRGSCGRFALLLDAVRAITDTGEVAALVDLDDHLDPQTASTVGIQLERLLWLRPQRLAEAVGAAELLVNAGFPLVALDLGLPPVPGRAAPAAWLRLARSAVTHRSAVLVSAPYRVSGCAATVVLCATAHQRHWSGVGTAPRLLHGLTTRVRTQRRRGHRPGEARRTQLVLAHVPRQAPVVAVAPPHRRREEPHATAL